MPELLHCVPQATPVFLTLRLDPYYLRSISIGQ